jgi:DNA-binding GntR family transcriptional regulator
MEQSPSTNGVSLRTFNQNFEGKSDTLSAEVYLVSPEVAAVSAINGYLSDPRDLGKPHIAKEPESFFVNDNLIIPPANKPNKVKIIKGSNKKPFPAGKPLSLKILLTYFYVSSKMVYGYTCIPLHIGSVKNSREEVCINMSMSKNIFGSNLEEEKRKYKYLRDFIFEKLKEAIINKRIIEETRITEDFVSKHLDVSRTPAREAIYRLASSGIIKIIPHRGFIVKKWSFEEVKNVLDLRMALETLAIKLAIRNISPEEVADIKTLLIRMKAAIENNDIKLSDDLNTLFHKKIFIASRNNELINVMKAIQDKIHNFRIILLYRPKEMRKLCYREHKYILNAIIKKDEKLASKLIASHIDMIKKTIVEKLKNNKNKIYGIGDLG